MRTTVKRPFQRRVKDRTSKWRDFIRLLAYVNQPLHKSWWCGTFVDGLPARYRWAFTESAFGYYSLTPAGWAFYYDFLLDAEHPHGDIDIYKWIMKKSCLAYLFRGVQFDGPASYDNLTLLQLCRDYPKIFTKKLITMEQPMGITAFKKYVGKLQRHFAKEAFNRTLRGKWNYNFSYTSILSRMGMLRKVKNAKSKFDAYVAA